MMTPYHQNHLLVTRDCQEPISRTLQYKKITKPLLERKRRARINRCLDELKELMVGALEAEGENISKLEKADILELTVRHLHKLRTPKDAVEDAQRFQAGFSQCASEACQYLLRLPGIDARIGQRLVSHLSQCVVRLAPLSIQVSAPRMCCSPPLSPATPPMSQCSRESSPHALSSTPSVEDLDRPQQGLLMTVPERRQQGDSSGTMWRPW